MKTTLDLPEDVALALRLESARRGGRRAASYSKLVADAIRQVYMEPRVDEGCVLDLQEGRAVVYPPEGRRQVSSGDVRNALDDG